MAFILNPLLTEDQRASGLFPRPPGETNRADNHEQPYKALETSEIAQSNQLVHRKGEWRLREVTLCPTSDPGQVGSGNEQAMSGGRNLDPGLEGLSG